MCLHMNHVCYACAMYAMQVAAARAYALGRRLGTFVHAQFAAVRLHVPVAVQVDQPGDRAARGLGRSTTRLLELVVMLIRVARQRGARPVAGVGHLVRLRSFDHQRRSLLQLACEEGSHLDHASLEAGTRLPWVRMHIHAAVHAHGLEAGARLPWVRVPCICVPCICTPRSAYARIAHAAALKFRCIAAGARLRVAEAGVDPRAVGTLAGEEARHDHAVVGRVEAGVGAGLGLLPVGGEGVGFVVTRREALLSVRVRVRVGVRVRLGAGERVGIEARVRVRIRARVRLRVGLGLASPALRLRAARRADPWAASP